MQQKPILILLFSTWAFANLPSDSLEEITVITGSKAEEQMEAAIENILVISRQQIEALGAQNAEEALRSLPGVSITHHPMAKVSIQGFDGDYVKILVDGVELAGDVGGAYPVNLISASDIEQIEVLKGAASALHGSDALGGVVNIITRKNKQKGYTGNASQTVYSNHRLAGQVGSAYLWDQWNFQVAAHYDHDDGRPSKWKTPFDQEVNIYPVAQMEQEGARSRIQWADHTQKMAIFGNWQQAHRLSSGASGMETRFEDDGWGVGAEFEKNIGQTALFTLQGSMKDFNHSTQQTNLAYNTDLPKTKAKFRDYESESKLGLELHEWHSLLVGIQGTWNTMDGDDFTSLRKTANVDIFVQDIIHIQGLDRWQVVPGVRLSNQLSLGEEPYDLTATPKLSIRFSPDSQSVYRLSYGMGYKRPSLQQKYWLFFHAAPSNFMLLGNPDLKPEQSHGLNASGDWALMKGLKISASAFGNYIFNLITTEIIDESEGTATDLSGNTRNYIHVRTYVNKEKALTAGGDLGLDYKQNGYECGVSYSYLIAKNKVNDHYENMTGKSQHSARAHVGKNWNTGTLLSVFATWNGPQLYSETEKTYTPDYLRIDLSAQQKWGSFLTLGLGIQNLLNNWNIQDGDYSENSVNQENHFGLYDGRIYYAQLKLDF